MAKREKKETSFELHKLLQLVAAIAIIVGIILVITLVINPMIKYGKATAALEQGEYQKAIELFGQLGKYRDSLECKVQAEMLYSYEQGIDITDTDTPKTEEEKETSYLRAKSYISNKKYDKAAAILRNLIGYKDSAELLEPYKFFGLSAGDTLTMGAWEQDNDRANGSEAISWSVVNVAEDHMVLLADSILECMAYDENGSSDWSASTVRAFLNGDFYDKAFTAEEKGVIGKRTTVTEDNPDYKTKSGSECKDSVILLSIDEYRVYMSKADSKKAAEASEYAKKRGCHDYVKEKGGEELHGSWFWLRSAGYASGYAAICYSDGEVGSGGQLTTAKLGVRPAIIINLVAPEN